MNGKRILVLFGVLAIVAAVAAAGWVAGSSIASPAEVAARTAPPTPSPILVPVEERVLSSRIVTRGTARFGLPQPISIAPSMLKAKPGLFTTLPLRNTPFSEGDVLLTASGRPVFVLQGEIPAYRDLVPGISGKDVLQLEQALARLGYAPVSVDGTYDEQTSAAVANRYSAAGWEPFGPTIEQLAHLRTLEQTLADATKTKLIAENAVAAAARQVAAARAKAEHANGAAAADVEAKIAARDKATADLANAEQAVEAARATSEHKQRLASADLEAKKAARKQFTVQQGKGEPLPLESARAALVHAKKAGAADIATKISDRALVVLDPRSTETSRRAADAQLETARANAFATQLQAELAFAAAQREIQLADQQLALAEAALKAAQLEGEAAVKASQNAQRLAEHEAKNAKVQVEVARAAEKAAQLESEATIQAALDTQKIAELEAAYAQDTVDRLAADLEVAQRKVGVQVPVDEVVFLPALPVRVHEVTALVGDVASGPVMSVTDNQLSVDSSLTLEAAPLVKPGMEVLIDEQALRLKAKGVVQYVSDAPGTHGVDGYHIYMEVRVTETNGPLEGFSVRLTIPVESTEGAVLAVPTSALSLAADGTSRVQTERNGTLEYVTVAPGLSADGYVEVKPIDGTLEPDQLVVVGYDSNVEEETTLP